MGFATPQTQINWQNMEDTIQTWIASVCGVDVVWRDQDAVAPIYPYVTVKRLTGFVSFSEVAREQTLQPEIRVIKIVDTLAATYTATIKGSVYVYTKLLGDTVTTIRNGLLVLVQATPPSGVTATSSGADSISVTGGAGVPIDVSVTASMTSTITQEILLFTYRQSGRVLIELQAFVMATTGAKATYQNATTILDACLASLVTEQWQAHLCGNGYIPENTTGPDDLTEIDGAEILSRAVATISFLCTSNIVEDVGIIETVELENEILL